MPGIWVCPKEIKALCDSAEYVKKSRKTPERIFWAKAVVLLAQAKKCRDADHMSCLMYDLLLPDDATVAAALEDVRQERLEIPEYAHDCHTPQGRKAGKTKTDFFIQEFDALRPRMEGLFDDEVETLRRGKR